MRPLEALRSSEVTDTDARIGRSRLIAGVLSLFGAAGIALLVWQSGPTNRGPALIMVAMVSGVLALRATGGPFPLVVPVGELIATMVLVAALSTVAGLLPSRRAARASPTEVLAAT